MYNSEAYEMKRYHKMVLTHTRLYILHNLRPSELLWSSLLAKEVLSHEMVAEIKVSGTNNQQVAALLDVLPARGPEAFDAFCETLLECDHVHVAEHLKTLEATDQFREDIRKHAGPDLTDVQVDKFVNSFKRTTPAMQRFAERKFEVLLEEREDEINKKEAEMQKLETANSKLQLEVDLMSSFLSSFVEVSSTISAEVQQTPPSKHFLNEELKQLQKLRKQVENSSGNEQACEFYKNLAIIVKYIEEHADLIIQAGIKNSKAGSRRAKSCIKLEVGKDVSLLEKMGNLVSSVSGFIDDLEHYPSVPTDMIRTELQKVHSHAKNMSDDVTLVQSKLKQKRKVEMEILSLLHNLKETWRLERELKEKQHHINDLNKQGHLMKRKAGFKRKALNEIQLNLNQKKLQISEVQKAIETRIKSADVRMHHLLRLLPDDSSETDSNPDEESMGTCTPYTENLSLSGTFSRVKQNGEPYTLKPSQTTPRATSLSTGQSDESKITAKCDVPKSPDKSDGSKSSPGRNTENCNGVVKKGEADKENKSGLGSTIVGQAYKSRMTIPKQRTSRTVVSTRRIQITGGPHASNQTQQTTTANISPTKNSNNDIKQENVGASEGNNGSDSSPRKNQVKRQYESSSESDSQPSSAGIHHSHHSHWPGAGTGEQHSPKRSPRHQKLAKKAESEESDDDDDDDEDEVLEIREVVSKEPTRSDMGRAAQASSTTPGSSSTIVTSSTNQNQRYQYVMKGRTPPAKTGMSREEYYRYRYPTGGTGVGPTQMPMTIGSYHKLSKEIPSSGGAVIRQHSNTTSVYKQSDDGGDPNSPTNNKRPGFRTYLNTKRVEPTFKLPGD